jgi:cyanate permease
MATTRTRLFETPTHVRVLVLAVLLIAVNTQPVFLLGAGALQIGRELGFGATGLGYLTAVFFLTAGVVSSPVGRVVQRIGWQQAMRFNIVGTGVMLLLMSVAIRNFASLAILLVMAAFFYGFGNPAANLALAQLVAPERQGLVFGLKHAGIPTSTLLAGLAVPLVILTVGWRWSFVIAAAMAAGVYLLVPTELPEVGPRTVASRTATPLLSPGRLMVVAVGGLFATVAPSMLGTFTVTASVDAGIGEATAGVLLSVGGLVTITARTVIGAMADHYRWRGFGAMAGLFGLGALAAVSMVWLTGAGFVLVLLVAFATAWGWPGLMTFSVVRANAGSVASSSAVAQAGVFVGAGAAPVAIGVLADRVSFGAAWILVAVGLALAAATIGWVAARVAQTA